MCTHRRPCPAAHAPDRDAAALTTVFWQQGWGRRCNGVIVFDTGEILPDGRVVEPHRLTPDRGGRAA